MISMDWFSWENLQETVDFLVKYGFFRCKFSLKPIQGYIDRYIDPYYDTDR